MIMMPRAPFSLGSRFWSKVAASGASDCWDWLGGTFSGHGAQYYFCGRPWTAPRLVWASIHGDPGPKVRIEHSCRNRKCCNPAHLYAAATSTAQGTPIVLKMRRTARITFAVTAEDRARIERAVLRTHLPLGILCEQALRAYLDGTEERMGA